MLKAHFFAICLCLLTGIGLAGFSAQALPNADPLAKLDCAKLVKDKNLDRSGTLPDPEYYRDAMKGLEASWAKLNELSTQLQKKHEALQRIDGVQVSVGLTHDTVSQSEALNDLEMMKGWLGPARRQYHQLEDPLASLTACMTRDCVQQPEKNRWVITSQALDALKANMAKLTEIHRDMEGKLKSLVECDPVIQTQVIKGSDTFATQLRSLQSRVAAKKKRIRELTELNQHCQNTASAPILNLGSQDLSKFILPSDSKAKALPAQEKSIPAAPETHDPDEGQNH